MLDAVDDRPRRPVPLDRADLASVAERWRRRGAIGRVLGAWENFVFAVEDGQHCAVLRITEGSRRSWDEVDAELEFIEHLSRRGFRVPEIVRFEDGSRTLAIEVGGRQFVACLFAEVPGEQLSGRALLALPGGVELWGRLIGELHNAASSFRPAHRARKVWTANELIADASHSDGLEQSYRSALRSVVAELRSLAVSDHDFGLVHADLHGRNVLAAASARTVIDFDDMCYHWHGYDVAVAWNWLCQAGGDSARLRSQLLDGYSQVRGFSRESDRLLPRLAFMRTCLDCMFINQRRLSGVESPLIDAHARLLSKLMRRQIATVA